MKIKETKAKQVLMLIMGLILSLTAIGCSDNDPKNEFTEPNSFISEFVKPDNMFMEKDNFNVKFIYNPLGASPAESHIDGCMLTDFTLIAKGDFINFKSTPKLYLATVEKFNDLNAPEILPTETWDYRPLTEAITTIHLRTYKFTDLLPDIPRDTDCSRYFDISFISYYDYIQNGYSWEGIENPGPFYKMSLEEFNKMGPKYLIDAYNITLYPSEVVAENYINTMGLQQFDLAIHVKFENKFEIDYEFSAVSADPALRLHDIVETFNNGRLGYFPSWPLLKAPKR